MTDAKRSLAMLEDMARRMGPRWANAGTARCRGMLAREDQYEREFQTALALYGEEMAFERARTRLALGMRRRRSRRRTDAWAALHEALAYFDRSGAEPWAMQARAELTATGEMPPRGFETIDVIGAGVGTGLPWCVVFHGGCSDASGLDHSAWRARGPGGAGNGRS